MQLKGWRHTNSDLWNEIFIVSYLAVDYQLYTNCIPNATSANQKRHVCSHDLEARGSKCSLGTVSLNPPCLCSLGGPVLESSDPPVSLLSGRLTSVASCWIVTKGRLVVKYCTSLFPITDAIFEVKHATCYKKKADVKMRYSTTSC